MHIPLLHTSNSILLAMDARCVLSTRGHQDGTGICNERKGDSARNATWKKAPCERGAAAASPFLGSAIGSTVKHPGDFSNSIFVTENTEYRPASEKAWQSNCGKAKRVLCTCFRRRGGKMELLDLPNFSVLLAGIALCNVYESDPAVKIWAVPYISLCSETFSSF